MTSCHYLLAYTNAETPETQTTTEVDAFTILMSASKKANHLPEKHPNVTKNKLKLHHDVIDWLAEQSVGFLSTNKESLGKTFVNTLVDALWYIDGNGGTLESCACHIPDALQHLKDYRCPMKTKKRKIDPSCLQEPTLQSHATELGQSFFIFRFTDPPDQFFWKLKKKREIFFNFIFLFPSHSCSSVIFFRFVFSIAARLIKLPPVTALGEILPF